MSARRHPLRCIAWLLMSGGCASGFQVYPAEKAPPGQSYLYYALPRTVLVITVPLRKTTRAAGDCSVERLADEIGAASPSALAGPPAKTGAPSTKPKGEAHDTPAAAPAPEPSAARQKALEMLKEAGIEPFDPREAADLDIGSITIASRAEPDPDNVFAIALSSGFLAGTTYNFELSADGVLGSTSRRSESLVSDYATQAVSIATTAAGVVLGFGGATRALGTCQRALDELQELRGSRRALVEGKSNTQGLSKETLELMLAELRAIENSFVSRFAGKSSSIQGSVVCEHTPGSALAKPVDLFSFTSRGVIAAAPDCIVPAELRDAAPANATASAGGAIELALRRASAIAEKARSPESEREAGEDGRGIYYRIPAQAFVDIEQIPRGEGAHATRHPLASVRVDMAQFGRVVSLPGKVDVGDASRNYAVKLDPVTGAILSYGPPAEAGKPQ